MQTLQQQRAHHALTQIRQLDQRLIQSDQQKFTNERGEFRSHVRNLPAMIHSNGLGQAIAFYYSKQDKKSYLALCNILADWLLGESNIYALPATLTTKDGEALLKTITENDMYAYLNAQAEALAYLEWVKKFAEALIENTGKTHESSPTL